jgi:hypothetical protein
VLHCVIPRCCQLPLLCDGIGCRPPCADCLRDGERVPAGYSCMELKCDLRSLCDHHCALHKRWGHAVSVLVGDGDDDGAPAPSTLLGVTHCPKPEHAGSEGCLSFVCKQCKVLLCQGCIGDHASAGHTVNTVDVVGKEQVSAISAALPELRQGVTHQVAQAAQARSLLETLALNRSVALEALAAATARLHADVDARHAAMVREIDAAYDAKVAGLQRELSAARGCGRAFNDGGDGRGSAGSMHRRRCRQCDVCARGWQCGGIAGGGAVS